MGAAALGGVAGDFYAVFPHALIVAQFAPVFAFAVAALALGVRGFWRDVKPGNATAPALVEAGRDAFVLGTSTAGTGRAATTPTMPSRSPGGGFTISPSAASCRALPQRPPVSSIATCSAGSRPHPLASLPELLGVTGGIGPAAGTAGLWQLNVWRHTGALALLLATHLGAVLALFATLPCGKFAHGVFCSAALLKWAIEKRRPSTLPLGDE